MNALEQVNALFADVSVELTAGEFIVHYLYREDQWDAGSWYEVRRWTPRDAQAADKFLSAALSRPEAFREWVQDSEFLNTL